MAEPKTRPTDVDVTSFLDSVPSPRRREEGFAMRELMERITGQPAVMWGPTMVGFGAVPDAKGNDWFVVGFAPRAAALTVYGVRLDDPLMEQLGPHTSSVACLYIKRLEAVDLGVLEKLVANGWESRR